MAKIEDGYEEKVVNKITKIISSSRLSELAWQYVDSAGDKTTEGGVKYIDNMCKGLAKKILKVII